MNEWKGFPMETINPTAQLLYAVAAAAAAS